MSDTGDTTKLRVVGQPWLSEFVMDDGELTITSDPDGVDVEASKVQDVYDQAAAADVTIMELLKPEAPPSEAPPEGGETTA